MTVTVETGLWQLDTTASTVALRHRTLWGLATVKGALAAVGGRGEVGADGSATGTVTLDATSLDTRNGKRDEHLKSADFLDAGKHPEITFVVGEARLRGEGAAHVTGELTVRGVSRPLTLTARVVGADAGTVTLDVAFTVDRHEFGVTGNQMGMIRGLTMIEASLRFTRAD
ncbi:YceI family protein [Streptomyces sp. NPDC086077]|uniref:YceI family protein n=1 Tax=Streptomyces sp. NPDC086077 TaxID=3154862 RepID=UPI00344870CA